MCIHLHSRPMRSFPMHLLLSPLSTSTSVSRQSLSGTHWSWSSHSPRRRPPLSLNTHSDFPFPPFSPSYSYTSSDSPLGYWDAINDSERKFRWGTEYRDDSWLFDRRLDCEEEKKLMWRKIRLGLKNMVLRRRF